MKLQCEFARAFKAGEEWFVLDDTVKGRFLQVQIFKNVQTGRLCVRKTPHRRARIGHWAREENEYYNKIVRVSNAIKPFQEENLNPDLVADTSFPDMLHESTIQPAVQTMGGKYTQEAYFSFLGGYTLQELIDSTRLRIPDQLIVRWVGNMLGSLRVLYSMTPTRYRLQRIEMTEDCMLHCRGVTSRVPDLFIADFGDPVEIPANGSVLHNNDQELLWDIPSVMLVVKLLWIHNNRLRFRGVWPAYRNDQAHSDLLQYGLSRHDVAANSLGVLYRLLHDMNAKFFRREIGFVPLPSIGLGYPDGFDVLAPLDRCIEWARSAYLPTADLNEDWRLVSNCTEWEQVLQGPNKGMMLYSTVDEAKTEGSCRGPFYIAHVDKATKEIVSIDESRPCHLPNVDDEDPDTDVADDSGNDMDASEPDEWID